ncbi:MAG: hypothetical protein PHO37_18275 [Kiritimatiellae bacterium]|nr:hypothetical protein [Kiritimatiellia bacterium]
MRLCLCVVLCLLAHSVCAVDFDVSQRGAFIVLKQLDGSTLVLSSAIRMSHISSVTRDRIAGEYRITIITTLRSDSSGPTQQHYELKADDRRIVDNTFDKILDLLGREQTEKSTADHNLRR